LRNTLMLQTENGIETWTGFEYVVALLVQEVGAFWVYNFL